MRRTLSGVALSALLALGAVGCAGSSGAGGSGGNGVLDPSGAASPPSAAPATAATGPASASGVRAFHFPAGVQVQFQTPLPASGPQRAAMIGYENYVDSLWEAVSTRGSVTAYRQYIGGNALTFADNLIAEFRAGDYKLSGKVVYFNTSVPQVFYSDGAVVQSCVDASGLYMVSAKTGKVAGTVFDSAYQHYQEQAAAGKSAAGYWTISHTQNTPASRGGSAGVCI